MAEGLVLGQTHRERRLSLSGVDGAQAGAIDLGDVGAVGERERDATKDDGLGGHAFQSQCRHPEADQVDEEDRRDAPKDVGVDDGEDSEREKRWGLGGPRHRDEEADHQDYRLDDHENPDVEPEGLEDIGEDRGEGVGVEEPLLDFVPAGAGDDQRREAAQDDDRRDGRDRRAAPRTAAPKRLALGATVPDDRGGLYSRIGASVASLSHCSSISAS